MPPVRQDGTRHDPIEIFRPGRRTSSTGEAIEFSEADLRATAEAYDPALHEAPIVVGHPRHDDPAYGWVASVAYAEGSLRAAPHQVNADFAELVRGGAFKKVSASFYRPDAEANPKPGVWYLRHVGFLGAQPPSLKGLKPVQFADGEVGVVTVEFAERNGLVAAAIRGIASTLSRVRDYLIEKEGAEKADMILPAWRADDLNTMAAELDAKDAPTASAPFSEPKKETDMPKDDDAALAARAAELADEQRRLAAERGALEAEQAAFAERETAQRQRENLAFLEALIAEGRLPPGHRDGMAAFMDAIHGGGTVSFGEGDGKIAQSPADYLRAFLSALPKGIDFTERAAGRPDGLDTADPMSIAEAAIAFQEEQKAKGIEISAARAVRHVKESSR